METSDPKAGRATGTAVIMSAVFLGYFLSRMDVPWWVKALGAIAMVVLTFVGFRSAFYERESAAPATRSSNDDVEPPA